MMRKNFRIQFRCHFIGIMIPPLKRVNTKACNKLSIHFPLSSLTFPSKLPKCYPASQPDLHPCFCTPEWWYCTVYRTRQWPASRMNIAKHEHYDAGKSETKFSLFGNPHIHLSSLTHLHWNRVAWYFFSLLIFKSWEPLITHFQDFHSFSFISIFYVVCIAFIQSFWFFSMLRFIASILLSIHIWIVINVPKGVLNLQ